MKMDLIHIKSIPAISSIGCKPAFKTKVNRTAVSELKLNPLGGNVGIGSEDPKSKLHVENGFSAGLTQKGHLMLGSESGPNLVFDENEIQARNNGQPASLILNKLGGRLHCGGLRDIGNKYSMRYDIAKR